MVVAPAIGRGVMPMPNKECELAEELPEPFPELSLAEDEMLRFPDELRWTMRAELPPGHGIVSASVMMIFTPP
jgi:hypothetical protein